MRQQPLPVHPHRLPPPPRRPGPTAATTSHHGVGRLSCASLTPAPKAGCELCQVREPQCKRVFPALRSPLSRLLSPGCWVWSSRAAVPKLCGPRDRCSHEHLRPDAPRRSWGGCRCRWSFPRPNRCSPPRFRTGHRRYRSTARGVGTPDLDHEHSWKAAALETLCVLGGGSIRRCSWCEDVPCAPGVCHGRWGLALRVARNPRLGRLRWVHLAASQSSLPRPALPSPPLFFIVFYCICLVHATLTYFAVK